MKPYVNPHAGEIRLIDLLMKFPGWRNFSGDTSVQALFIIPLLRMGFRVGITDDDVTQRPGIWFDIYPRFRYWLMARVK